MGSSTYSFFSAFCFKLIQEPSTHARQNNHFSRDRANHAWRVIFRHAATFPHLKSASSVLQGSALFAGGPAFRLLLAVESRFQIRRPTLPPSMLAWNSITVVFRKERAMSKAGGYSCVIFLKLYKDGRWKDWRIRRKDAHVKCASLSHLFKCGMVLFFPPRPGGHV